MRNEAIGYNLMATHVREKIDMLDAFIDLLEHMVEESGEGDLSHASYLATGLKGLRMGHGSGDLPRHLAYIAQHFVSVMAKDHMRDKPRR